MFKTFSLTTVALFAASHAWAGGQISYTVGDDQFEGYFAAADSPRGTVVILPTWNGLSDYEKDRATMLADMGFNAFAADLYAPDDRPTTMEERQTALKAVTSDQKRMHEILTAAVVEAEANGDGPVVVMGYSMGALVTMELARSGLGNSLGVDAYAIFSGRVSDTAGRMMPDDVAPFFVAIGEADERVPVSSLEPFMDDVDLAGGSVTAHTYLGVGHLFSAFGFPNYNQEADKESWEDFTSFLSGLTG